MGKGSKNRISSQSAFNRGHEKACGKHEKVDGRKTLMVVRNGKLIPKAEADGWIQAIPPVDFSEHHAHIERLRRRQLESMGSLGVTADQLGVRRG